MPACLCSLKILVSLCTQTYFSLVLEERRELWDSSNDIEAFFFPGPPTSYSAALSRRRSEQLKEVRDLTV